MVILIWLVCACRQRNKFRVYQFIFTIIVLINIYIILVNLLASITICFVLRVQSDNFNNNLMPITDCQFLLPHNHIIFYSIRIIPATSYVFRV